MSEHEQKKVKGLASKAAIPENLNDSRASIASTIDFRNMWKYKPDYSDQNEDQLRIIQEESATDPTAQLKLARKSYDLGGLQMAASVCADADRLSEVLGGPKLEELANYQNSRSTAEEDPVLQIHEKSKKLREKHAKYEKQQKRLA